MTAASLLLLAVLAVLAMASRTDAGVARRIDRAHAVELDRRAIDAVAVEVRK